MPLRSACGFDSAARTFPRMGQPTGTATRARRRIRWGDAHPTSDRTVTQVTDRVRPTGSACAHQVKRENVMQRNVDGLDPGRIDAGLAIRSGCFWAKARALMGLFAFTLLATGIFRSATATFRSDSFGRPVVMR